MNEINYLSVSELNRLLNLTLEDCLPQVCFEGEISELTRAASGHMYLTLKDKDAEARIILWAGTARNLTFKVETGLKVQCHGRPNVYQKSGRLQIVVHKMQPAGSGDLQKKFAELKLRLEKEGLFSDERKRKLPFLPKAIGIVTSAQGAVLHDIMVRLRERMPQIPVYLVDVRVQGVGAAEDIAAGIKFLSESGKVDVIIAGRGGGSLEDLWAFNEEVVVRAFFASRVPIISAVGHEVDVSLSDMAADVRAPTPTAAAEMVVPRRDELLRQIAEYERRLLDFERWIEPLKQQVDELVALLTLRVQKIASEARLHLNTAEVRLKSIEPQRLIELQYQKVAVLSQKMVSAIQRCVSASQMRLQRLASSLVALSPLAKVQSYDERVMALQKRMSYGMIQNNQRLLAQIDSLGMRLEAVSPKAVLGRGYSIVEARGRVVTSSQDLALDEEIKVVMASGGVSARVTAKS